MSVLNVLRALRAGPLTWSRGGWIEARVLGCMQNTYGETAIDELVRRGFAKTVFRRKGRNRRIVSGSVEMRPFGALYLKHVDAGYHVDIGQGVEIENRKGVDRQNGRFRSTADSKEACS